MTPDPTLVQQSSNFLILGLATTLASVITAAIGGIVAVLVARLNTKATNAATQVEKVAVKLSASDGKIDAMARVVDDTHTLVNSNMEKALLVSSIALRRVANLTKDPADEAAAEVAESALIEHRKKQKMVDTGMKIATDSSVAKVKPDAEDQEDKQ